MSSSFSTLRAAGFPYARRISIQQPQENRSYSLGGPYGRNRIIRWTNIDLSLLLAHSLYFAILRWKICSKNTRVSLSSYKSKQYSLLVGFLVWLRSVTQSVLSWRISVVSSPHIYIMKTRDSWDLHPKAARIKCSLPSCHPSVIHLKMETETELLQFIVWENHPNPILKVFIGACVKSFSLKKISKTFSILHDNISLSFALLEFLARKKIDAAVKVWSISW